MPPVHRSLLLCGVVFVSASIGCSTPITEMPARMLHELKPHRLAIWNRGPKLGRDHATFSISDTTADAHAGLPAAGDE